MIPALGRRLLYSLLLVAASALSLTGNLDQASESYTDAALKRALFAFAIARGLNGVISVAQGTEIALQPAGLGVTLTPGEILDPVNDLVERFSWVMLASSASLGMQKLLLQMSVWHGFAWATATMALLALLALWWPRRKSRDLQISLMNVALVLVFLRFAVPLSALTSEWVYQTFLEPEYEEATAALENTSQRIGEINQQVQEELPAADEDSLLDKAKRFYDSTTNALSFDSRIEAYKSAAENASEQAIRLITVFIFQTVVLPLGFLFALYSFGKNLLRRRWQTKVPATR